VHDTGNTADIADAAGLLWQVVRSNEACLRHHECQKTWNLLLSSLLQLQQLQSRLPLPTRATFNKDILRDQQERLNQESGLTPDSSQLNQENTPTEEHLIHAGTQEGLPCQQQPDLTPARGALAATEWEAALEFRQDISKSSIEEAINGI
jgi:hypothetical protein